ncbi:unnamed protein product [Sphagnum jensenii]|uniref:Uncharacterized protein n=1 Tax=Sphagnum jensenii TaxID=128206 RepID=A0ABP0W575_9BRYO
MVAAVALSSTPSPASSMQEAQLLEKKSEGENGHHFGGLPAAEKTNTTAVRKLRNREITSRYKAATVAPTPPVAPLVAAGRRNPSPLRQPSSPSRQSSPVRNRSSSSNTVINATTEVVPVRHPSPNLGRCSNAPDVPKRAFSAERRRPWPAVTSDGKLPSTSSVEKALASVKPHAGAGRGPELWPSMSASKKVVSNGIPVNGSWFEGRGEESSHPSDHTLKPAANGAHRSTDPAVRSPQRKGSPVRRQSMDQAENARPATNLHMKPDQQRWPGISNGKGFGGAMTRSVDLSIDRERPLSRSAAILIQGQPGTASSRTARPTASRSLTRSVNEGPAMSVGQANLRRNPTPTKGRVGLDTTGAREAAGRAADGAQQSHSTAGGDPAMHLRQLSQDSVATVDSCVMPFENVSDTESVSSGGSGPGCRGGPGQGTAVPARVWQDMSSKLRRFSEGNRMHAPESDIAAAGVTGVKAVRRSRVVPMGTQQLPSSTASMTGSMTSPWSFSPGRVINNPGSIPQFPTSPQPTKASSSPLRGLPSPQRSRPVSAATIAIAGTARNLGGMIVNFGFDGRSRGKKALTQQEEAMLLRIYHNRWLQWRFVNARAEAVMSAQKSAAERSLYNVWLKTSELRKSVAMQRIKLQQARQAHKLWSILSKHAAHLDSWETLEEEHSSALTGAMEALEAAILRVPVTGGAKADVHAVGEALGSAVDVLNAVEVSVTSLSAKAESTDMLLSQLAETSAQERVLLEECGHLLSVAASLEVEERSLRTHLIQLECEKGRASATLPMSGRMMAGNHAWLSTS